MTLENGSTHSFTVGNDINFTYNQGMYVDNDGLLECNASFTLVNPQLTNKLDIVFDLDFDIAAISGSAWYDVWLANGSKDFGPLVSESFDIVKGSMNIYNQTFNLGGFNTVTTSDSIAIV